MYIYLLLFYIYLVYILIYHRTTYICVPDVTSNVVKLSCKLYVMSITFIVYIYFIVITERKLQLSLNNDEVTTKALVRNLNISFML